MDMVSGVSMQGRYLGFGVHVGAEGKYIWTVADAKKDTDTSLNPDIEGFLVTGNIGARF